MRLRLSETALDQDDRRVGEGNLAQVLSDVDELAVLGAEYIVLDTNPDHPGQRRPAAVDWRMLEAVMRNADRYAS
jgi:hypothetical protein